MQTKIGVTNRKGGARQHALHLGVIVVILAGLLFSPVILDSPVVQAQAPNPNLKIELRAGFDGFYKEFKWMPVQVTLANDDATAPPINGRIEVSFSNFAAGSTLYQREVQLTAPYRKTYWVYVIGPRALPQVQARVVADSGTIIARASRDIRSLSDTDFLLGVLSDDTSALNYLNGEYPTRKITTYSSFGLVNSSRVGSSSGSGNGPRTTIAHLQAGDIPPNAAGLNSLDGLVISDLGNVTYNSDPAALRSSVSSWLATGKALIVAGDSPLRRAAFLNPLLPVTSTGAPTRANDLSELRNFTKNNDPLPETLSLASTALVTNPPGAETILKQGQTPLVATRPYGLGRSWFIGLDISSLQRWNGAKIFWSGLLSQYEPRSDYAALGRRTTDYDAENWLLALTPNPRQIEPPTITILALFLFAYILVIGPINYVVLNRIGRRELTWLTVPVITVIFCGITYFISNAGVGSDLIVSRVAIVTAGQDNEGQINGNAVSIAGIYSNGRNEFELKVTENTLANGIFGSENSRYSRYAGSNNTADSDGPTIKQGPNGTLGRINLTIGGVRGFSFENESNRVLNGTNGIVADLQIVNGKITGTIQNTSNQEWQDVALFVPGTQTYLAGNLKPKQQIQINPNAPNVTGYNLVEAIVGTTNFPSGSYQNGYYYPRYYYNGSNGNNTARVQRAAVLETLFGPNGEGLPRESNRVWLVAWNSEANNQNFNVTGRSVQNVDMTVLFEGLAAK